MPSRDGRDLARLLLRKAAGDVSTLRALRGDRAIPDEILGFHAQQAVEKLLKALLASRGVEFPRTHDLAVLLSLVKHHGVPAPPEFTEADALTPWAIEFRYEQALGETLDREAALTLVERIGAWAAEQVKRTQGGG